VSPTNNEEVTMDNPRPEKVAVVDEVRRRFTDSEAALLTEYRGINVAEMQVLRRSLRQAGGDYKIYKNTLVRFATRDLGLELDEMLVGPTAIAFVPTEGTGDPVMVAKALRDFARGNPSLVVKGGVLGDKVLSEGDARALAEIAPREELLAKLAGLMAAPMQQFAGLLQAMPRDLAYGLRALVDQGGGAPADAGGTTETAEAPATETAPTESETEPTETPSTDTPASAEAADEPADTPEPAADDVNPTEES
jgi:large subunit ribosomal protein L10